MFKDCINNEKQFASASVLYSTLHLNVFGPINKAINKDSQYIYQLSRLSTLSHWTLDLPVSFSRKDADLTVYHMSAGKEKQHNKTMCVYMRNAPRRDGKFAFFSYIHLKPVL